MKNLIIILISISCYANGQGDSVAIVKKLNQLEQVNNETKVLLKKSDKIDKENRNLIYRIKMYIERLIKSNELEPSSVAEYANNRAVKPKNINEPVVEVEVPIGYDTIRGNFIYRLFHKEKIYIRPYKIVNNEKIYMD